MSPVFVRLRASALLPASELLKVVTDASPRKAFRFVALCAEAVVADRPIATKLRSKSVNFENFMALNRSFRLQMNIHHYLSCQHKADGLEGVYGFMPA